MNALKPRSRATRLVRSESWLKLVRRLFSRSRLFNLVRPAGKVRLVSPAPSIVSEVRFASPLGREKLVSGLTLRSSVLRFVNSLGREKLVRLLIWRSSETRLRAASSPTMLLTFRRLAFKFVRLSRSCSVNGPNGFCRAARMAPFRPGSGMDTSCATTGTVRLVRINKIRMYSRELLFALFNGICFFSLWFASLNPCRSRSASTGCLRQVSYLSAGRRSNRHCKARGQPAQRRSRPPRAPCRLPCSRAGCRSCRQRCRGLLFPCSLR